MLQVMGWWWKELIRFLSSKYSTLICASNAKYKFCLYSIAKHFRLPNTNFLIIVVTIGASVQTMTNPNNLLENYMPTRWLTRGDLLIYCWSHSFTAVCIFPFYSCNFYFWMYIQDCHQSVCSLETVIKDANIVALCFDTRNELQVV